MPPYQLVELFTAAKDTKGEGGRPLRQFQSVRKSGASRAPAFDMISLSEPINAERSHIHRWLFGIHHLGEQFAGGRAQGKALMAVPEGEP